MYEGMSKKKVKGKQFHFMRSLLTRIRFLMVVGGVFLALSGVNAVTEAADLCVRPGGIGGCYALPSGAIAVAGNDDTVQVHAGVYQESNSISITQTGLKIIGDSPVNTILLGSNANVFFVAQNAKVEIANLTITGGSNGIYVDRASAHIHHNHIVGNGIDGIYLYGTSAGDVLIANNVIGNNIKEGVGGNTCCTTSTIGYGIAYNNVFMNNGGYGYYDKISASYNAAFGNGAGTSSYYTTGVGNIAVDCLFEGADNGDFRLQPSSPCRDKGNISLAYNDVDGTRNDMGSFGGLSAGRFWPYAGSGGPVITNMVVDPPFVPEGGTISVNATAEIK